MMLREKKLSADMEGWERMFSMLHVQIVAKNNHPTYPPHWYDLYPSIVVSSSFY